MKTTHVIGAPQIGPVPHPTVSYLRSTAQRATITDASLQVRNALAQVKELQQALASSQQESIATRQQIALLTETNARLREFAVRRENTPARGGTQCSAWAPADFCLSAGLDPDATPHVVRLLAKRLRFRKGGVLYRVGDGFEALYAIRTGSCKAVLLAKDGHDQVSGYHMAGEIFGMDGIGTDFHECQVTALEDLEVCPLPFDQVENLARLSDRFRHNLHRLLSQENTRLQTLMLVLGTMRAEQRLAVFLLDLSQRYRVRGYSPCEFVLRMTREEIGSYLGLKLETVSRLFSRFQHEGLIQVQGRTVKLLDRVAVSKLVDCGA